MTIKNVGFVETDWLVSISFCKVKYFETEFLFPQFLSGTYSDNEENPRKGNLFRLQV